MKCWETGANSRLVLETFNGNAWVNLSCCLGRPHVSHVVSTRKKSRNKEVKDNLRAAVYQQKRNIPDEPILESVNDDKNDNDEAKEETIVEGFVDCSVEVQSSYYTFSTPRHEEMNNALNVAIRKYIKEKFKDVEISKIDFRLNGPRSNDDQLANTKKKIHLFKIHFKQRGKEEELMKRDFCDEMNDLMKSGQDIPIPLEKKYLVLENENVKLNCVNLVK